MQSVFSPSTVRWFTREIGQPTAIQDMGWPRIRAGENVLISAPTGTGKTLAAFLCFIDSLAEQARKGELPDELQVVYISPLKALGNDIRENLKRPLAGLECENTVRVAVRTGDTTQSERQRMIRRPPHILITTPESLYLLLTSESGRGLIRTARAVILDELHAVLSTKRGAHLFVSLARLDALHGRPLQRIGLSATVEPLPLAAQCLAPDQPVAIISPKLSKKKSIRVVNATPDMRVLPQATIWPEIAQTVHRLCKDSRASLCFLEGRSQAEKLAFAINEIEPGFAMTHHGCVSKEQRLKAENALRSGELRLMCATSSMELGIDVGDIDLVIQIGCPMTVSATLQRLGRAGHNPGRESVMHIFPKTPADALSCGLTVDAALHGAIERATPVTGCLDVLSQQLISMATSGDWEVDAALAVLRKSYPLRELTRETLEGVLKMLAGDYEHERDVPVRARLDYDRINGRFSGDSYTRLLALSAGGTIPDRGWYAVTLPDGTRLGELDEEYVYEARIGDKFLLGAFSWRIQEIRNDRVIVQPTTPSGAQPPFWKGDGAGRAYETGRRFSEKLRGLTSEYRSGGHDALCEQLKKLSMDASSAKNAGEYLCRQMEATGCLPDDRTLIFEHFKDEAGEHQMMVHSVFGRRVNDALCLLLQREATNRAGVDVRGFCDDDGCLLYLMGTGDIPDGLIYHIDPDEAERTLSALLPSTPMFNMCFRYAAARAMLMGGRTGKRRPLWVQRLRGAELMSGAIGSADHPMIVETLRECLCDQMDMTALQTVLRGVRGGTVHVVELHLDEPSPMALPLRRQVEGVMMYEYSPLPKNVAKEALKAEMKLRPEQSLLDGRPPVEKPQSAERLHALFMRDGDMQAGEVDAPESWLLELAQAGRVDYIEPGLWIAAEEKELYERALADQAQDALCRVTRRLTRARGAQDAQSLCQRYFLPLALGQQTLDALAEQGELVLDQGLYYHKDVYRTAQALTLRAQRASVSTLPMRRYAALLSRKARHAGNPAQQLRQGVLSLLGMRFSPEAWEGALLPSRTQSYRTHMLDQLLAGGEFSYLLEVGEDGKPLVSFHTPQEYDEDGEIPLPTLTQEQADVLSALRKRGASFSYALSPLCNGLSVMEVLTALCWKGLVRADSYVPLRTPPVHHAPSRSARGRVSAAQGAGRWEATKPLLPVDAETALMRSFARYDVVTRETLVGISWQEALTLLRAWEYRGKVRRGYYVKGFSSGAQFILSEEYARVQAALSQQDDEVIWLHAADPMQPYGGCLPGNGFTRVRGAAVALKDGEVVGALEHSGEKLTGSDPDVIKALCDDFAQKRIFPSLKRLTLKDYPADAVPALEKAGFLKEMNDYVLWRM